jgi:ATP-dependent Lon protease
VASGLESRGHNEPGLRPCGLCRPGRRSGVKEIVLLALNERQLLEEVSEELRAGIRFHFVDTLEEALDRVFERRAPLAPVAARA